MSFKNTDGLHLSILSLENSRYRRTKNSNHNSNTFRCHNGDMAKFIEGFGIIIPDSKKLFPGNPYPANKVAVFQNPLEICIERPPMGSSTKQVGSGPAQFALALNYCWNPQTKGKKLRKKKNMAVVGPGLENSLIGLIMESQSKVFLSKSQKSYSLNVQMMFLQDWIFKLNYSNHL